MWRSKQPGKVDELSQKLRQKTKSEAKEKRKSPEFDLADFVKNPQNELRTLSQN